MLMSRYNFLMVVLFLLCCFQMPVALAQSLTDCSSCMTVLIKEDQIKASGLDELQLLSNEIFARKGHRFSKEKIAGYFKDKSWYQPAKSNDAVRFSNIEQQNIEFLKKRIKLLEQNRAALMAALKKFKMLVLSTQKASVYGYTPGWKEDLDYLSKTLNKLDFEAVNWYKHKGIYEVTVDDGLALQEYKLYIDKEKVSIKMARTGGSPLIKDFSLIDEKSVSEFSYQWIFEFTNGSFRFLKLVDI